MSMPIDWSVIAICAFIPHMMLSAPMRRAAAASRESTAQRWLSIIQMPVRSMMSPSAPDSLIVSRT